MKIKPVVLLSSLLITGIIVFLIISNIFAEKGLSNNQLATHVVSNNSTETAAALPGGQRTFDYQPETPVEGVLNGVVEIGATGLNSFVVDVDSAKRWKTISKDFGSSLIYEGLATTVDLQSKLNNYLSKIFDHAVEKENIFFIISSGAQKEPKTKAIVDYLNTKGYNVHTVTKESEALFGFLAAVPKSFRENSFFIDLGSGNTKIAWQKGGKIFTSETYGSKYYQKNLDDSTVYEEVLRKANEVPEQNRAFCFILGGIPFQMAEQIRKEEERYSILSEPKTYSATNNRMRAGINIYNALYSGTSCKYFVFDWDANFSIGYLLNLNR